MSRLACHGSVTMKWARPTNDTVTLKFGSAKFNLNGQKEFKYEILVYYVENYCIIQVFNCKKSVLFHINNGYQVLNDPF